MRELAINSFGERLAEKIGHNWSLLLLKSTAQHMPSLCLSPYDSRNWDQNEKRKEEIKLNKKNLSLVLRKSLRKTIDSSFETGFQVIHFYHILWVTGEDVTPFIVL